MSAVSMVNEKTHLVKDKLWTPAHTRLLKRAASYPEVERILVNPGIKKKLCDTVTGDRSWLRKVRPFWGHDYHFHIRIGCQPGSPGCKAQEATPRRRRLRQVAGLVVHRGAVAPQQEPGCAEGARRDDHGQPAEGMPRRARRAGPGVGGGGRPIAAAPCRSAVAASEREAAPATTVRAAIAAGESLPCAVNSFRADPGDRHSAAAVRARGTDAASAANRFSAGFANCRRVAAKPISLFPAR